ncbi:hypothetical protein BDW42DRAFT_168184 [Aspergillus taichungensis]|uniref:Uncharacterized protein n=1 Tax=Aspergillus taichungensis TaxID=482145 RepID=A0A2J5HWG4_9EURO|nr:hypothetical protein BDW42DRAFT_168184 [Aspergillus taichungensis]
MPACLASIRIVLSRGTWTHNVAVNRNRTEKDKTFTSKPQTFFIIPCKSQKFTNNKKSKISLIPAFPSPQKSTNSRLRGASVHYTHKNPQGTRVPT